MVDQKMLRVRLTRFDMGDMLLLRDHWRLSQSDVVRRAMREAAERVLVEIDTIRTAKARSDRMERLAMRGMVRPPAGKGAPPGYVPPPPPPQPVVTPPVEVPKPKPAVVWHENPDGRWSEATRCMECKTWRLDIHTDCPTCGKREPATRYDVTGWWLDRIKAGDYVVA